MTYSVKEIFTLQGEGANAGTAAVFCRFSGCNLWSGCEVDRERAICAFCDTDFVGTDGRSGGRFDSAADLVSAIERHWKPAAHENRFVVLTGGEPLLQVDSQLGSELHARGFRIAVETNVTIDAPSGIDWICVSPKGTSMLRLLKGDEMKVVVPQIGIDLAGLSTLSFTHRFVQPMDGPDQAINARSAVDLCLANPQWRLSLQTHKMLGIP